MKARPITLADVRDEVVGLHAFFVRWFCATPDSDLAFKRCDDALAPEFQMIAPDGAQIERAALVETLVAARGSAKPGFSIAIEALVPLWQDGDSMLVTYVEAQLRDGRPTRRRSSALFCVREPAPHGVAWRHLHETWM
jgi:hypothetical protein